MALDTVRAPGPLLALCRRCGINEFPQLTTPGARRRYCDACNAERSRVSTKICNDRRKALVTEFVQAAKSAGCARCGEADLRTLTFHHVNPEDKAFTIGMRDQTLARTKAEIAKCIVLCANCHLIVEDEARA